MKLENMSWDEAIQKVRGKTILVPHGSTEEHGYHLPLKTDALIAERICAPYYKSKNVVVAPTMNYTASKKTKEMPGTVGPNKKEYINWIESIIIDFLKLKPYRIVFFLGHDGRTQREVFSKLTKKFRMVHFIESSELSEKAMKRKIIDGRGHAGEGETSLMLFLEPKNVKMNKAVDEIWPADRAGKSGVNGYPTKATKDKGKALYKLFISEIAKEIR